MQRAMVREGLRKSIEDTPGKGCAPLGVAKNIVEFA
jgi:hypothetical protein